MSVTARMRAGSLTVPSYTDATRLFTPPSAAANKPTTITAVLAVATVISGWGVGQYPWLLVDQITINQAAGADATLRGLLVVVVLAGVIVLPALAYLFVLTQSGAWTAGDSPGPAARSAPGRAGR